MAFKLLAIICFSLISGCAQEKSEPTIQDVKNLISTEINTINGLLSFCRENKNAKWLGDETHEVDISSKISSSGESDIDSARILMDKIGAKSFSCSRNWSNDDYPLQFVIIMTYGVGLSISGRSKGIFFIADEKYKKLALSSKYRSYFETRYPGWYVYESE